MNHATKLNSQESQTVIGGASQRKIGPYGECFFYDARNHGIYGWFREEEKKGGGFKKCDEK